MYRNKANKRGFTKIALEYNGEFWSDAIRPRSTDDEKLMIIWRQKGRVHIKVTKLKTPVVVAKRKLKMGFIKISQLVFVIVLFFANLSSSSPTENDGQLSVNY